LANSTPNATTDRFRFISCIACGLPKNSTRVNLPKNSVDYPSALINKTLLKAELYPKCIFCAISRHVGLGWHVTASSRRKPGSGTCKFSPRKGVN
jgi:hypothetical protein